MPYSMYSFPSTSHTRQPLPRDDDRGEPLRELVITLRVRVGAARDQGVQAIVEMARALEAESADRVRTWPHRSSLPLENGVKLRTPTLIL